MHRVGFNLTRSIFFIGIMVYLQNDKPNALKKIKSSKIKIFKEVKTFYQIAAELLVLKLLIMLV